MLDNYEKMNNGVIRQVKINSKTEYNIDYINNRYINYKDKCVNMSYLRLGNIIGSIERVPTSILDVGYGSADFLSVCNDIIPNCFGFDINQWPLPDSVTFVDDIERDFFDVITFFDSLEHFEDISFVANLNCNFVSISLPWCHYHSDEWFKNWKHRRPDEHLFHFNEHSLNEFFKQCGFERVSHSNIEDTIRKDGDQNILSAVFKKIDSKWNI
tara:strand:+ start:8547 stop:9185 length:639 start_codon:yes stop_codon:yes gene_type:complete